MLNLIKTIIIFVFGIALSTLVITNNPVSEDISTDNQIVIPREKSVKIPDETEAVPDIPENITRDRIVVLDPSAESRTEILEEKIPVSKTKDLTTPPPLSGNVLSANELNTKIRAALVNIICTTKTGGLLNPITGSGIIIDEKGVILTNAHIAQYYLLRDYEVKDFITCNIRTGSPAVNTYKAELLFISSAWLNNNYQKIRESSPKGTGENDFALLLITEVTKPGMVLPEKFPFIPTDVSEQKPQKKDPVIVAGYPASFLGGISIQRELYAVSTITEVMDVFTFKENSLDLFSVGGNIAAQKGSSGGGIANLEGKLVGIVVTASEGAQTSDRDLRAISLSHINRSLKKETGVDLSNYLFGELLGKSIQFRTTIAPILTTLLESALNQ